MLNAQWLRSFSALVEAGSFTRAADRLEITQAAVSQHIGRLEAVLGALFIRHPRGLELTPSGCALRDYCAELEAIDRRLEARLGGTQDEVGEIGLITPGSIGLFLYPLLLDWQASHRGLVIRHRFAPDAEVLEAVVQNRFDLGLVTLRPDDPRLASRAFAEEPLELVVPAGCSVGSWDDLDRLGFIDHPDGRAMAGRLLSRQFPGSPGARGLRVSGFSNQIGLLLEPVARGLGFTVLPRYARRAFARADALDVVECTAPVVDTLWLIHRMEWPLSARAAHLVAHLQAALGTATPSP